jgi:glycine oxidase
MRNVEDFKGGADVVVVGGGVAGLAAARELARGGASVVVVERGRIGAEASWAAGGMLAPQAEADGRDEFFDLLSASRDLYPAFAEALHEETGIDIELERTGTLYLALTTEDAEEVERRFEWQARARLPVERLTAEEARALEPSVSPRVRLALRFPLDWQVENRRLVAALAASIEKQGGRLLTGTEALGVRVEAGRAVGVETSRGTVWAGAVLLAAGAWASHLPILGDSRREPGGGATVSEHPRIEPVRGQMLCFAENAALSSPFRHVIYSPRGYVVPRRDSRLLAGSTTEHVGYDKRVTCGGVHAITGHALEIAPDLDRLVLLDSWAGLRPRAADERPVLGASADVRNLFYATGFYRNGILLAPLSGEAMAALIIGGKARGFPARALESFSPERFGSAFAAAHAE